MKNKVSSPDYLKNFTVDVDSLEGYAFSKWFEKLIWKGQLKFNGNMLFKIMYCGDKCEDGVLKNHQDYPIVVFAENSKRLA